MSALIALRYFMCTCLMAYMYSCTVPPPMNIKDNAPVAKVAIGPKFKLLDVRVTNFSAVSDNDGQIYILAVSAESEQPRKLHYLTLSNGQQTDHKISNAEKYLENVSRRKYREVHWWGELSSGQYILDADLDSKDRLHAIIGKAGFDYDRHHLNFEKGEWQKLSNVRCEKIARFGDDLVCAFRAGQKDLSRLGGGNSRLRKLVVAQGVEMGWLDWTVFDYPTQGYVGNFLIAADNFGNLHTIYNNSHLRRLAYAQIRSSAGSNINHDIAVKKKPTSVSGTVLYKLEAAWGDMAIDPNSGDGIIASIPFDGYYMHISKRGLIGDPIQFLKGHGAAFKIAPSKDGGFQAIMSYTEDAGASLNYKLAYIQYYENEWSQYSVLEEGFHWALMFDIIYDGSGNALVIWMEPGYNDRGYLFGRWVRQNNSRF